jgi:hypothetical protein
MSRPQPRILASYTSKCYKPFYKQSKVRPFAREPAPIKKRLIDNPRGGLKEIQLRINDKLLKPLVLPDHLLGGVAGKSIQDNVDLHLGAARLVTIDIKSFFPSITPLQVYTVWRTRLNCSPKVATILTRLTTRNGYLPQGAPTSTLIANLVLGSVDCGIRTACKRAGVRYSSWLDDLAFSGPNAHELIPVVIRELLNSGFRVSHRKIKVMGPGDRKTLNKLVLGRGVSVDKGYLKRTRSASTTLRLVESLTTRLRHIRGAWKAASTISISSCRQRARNFRSA